MWEDTCLWWITGGRKRPTVVFRRLLSVSIPSELWLYEASDIPLIQEQTGACPTSSPGPTPCLICAPFSLENKNCDGFPREGEEM